MKYCALFGGNTAIKIDSLIALGSLTAQLETAFLLEKKYGERGSDSTYGKSHAQIPVSAAAGE